MIASTESDSAAASAALELVHEGWAHLQLQRPLAAWASWQVGLRHVPDFPAALEALATLEGATELPAAARTTYRFQTPQGAAARARWDERLQRGGAEELSAAALTFASLAVADPADAAAAYNEGLCLAWLGRNAEAIGALDRAVVLLAGTDFDRAVDAWTLAEVLRHGGGAEALADDLKYAWIIDEPDPEAADELADEFDLVELASPPADPLTGPRDEIRVFEWLDRPLPRIDTAATPLTAAQLPRLLATVVQSRSSLRLSSPDPLTLDAIYEPLREVLGASAGTLRREAVPLPLPLLDAAVWTLRFPRGLDGGLQQQLTREAVESFYEEYWIHVPRQGLGGRSPLAAAVLAREDPILRARLTAVVRLREQLGRRLRTALLYQGYPFDRLRRRLGLELADPDSVDPEDGASASVVAPERLVESSSADCEPRP